MASVQQQVVHEGHSVLLFCSSRKGCETSARHIAKFLPPFSILERKNASGPVDGNAAVEELRRCPAGLDAVLADTLPAGVAYHHAGLTVCPSSSWPIIDLFTRRLCQDRLFCLWSM